MEVHNNKLVIGDQKGTVVILEYDNLQWKMIFQYLSVLQEPVTSLCKLDEYHLIVGGGNGKLAIVSLQEKVTLLHFQGHDERK